MLVENTGTSVVTLTVYGEIIEIKPMQACEIPSEAYTAVKALFPRLLPVAATETVEIESEPEEIIEVAKNGKKSKKSGK